MPFRILSRKMHALMEAIGMEILEDCERMKRHESLLEKMKLCMQGEQDPPTVSEFMQWRADFRMALAFKSLYGKTPSAKP